MYLPLILTEEVFGTEWGISINIKKALIEYEC